MRNLTLQKSPYNFLNLRMSPWEVSFLFLLCFSSPWRPFFFSPPAASLSGNILILTPPAPLFLSLSLLHAAWVERRLSGRWYGCTWLGVAPSEWWRGRCRVRRGSEQRAAHWSRRGAGAAAEPSGSRAQARAGARAAQACEPRSGAQAAGGNAGTRRRVSRAGAGGGLERASEHGAGRLDWCGRRRELAARALARCGWSSTRQQALGWSRRGN
jgi:hypothetical protein